MEDIGRAWLGQDNSRVKRDSGKQTETLIKYELAGRGRTDKDGGEVRWV